MERVVLIGCGSSKVSFPTLAAGLYTGPLFTDRLWYARKFATTQIDHTLILSGLHGILRTFQKIDPYEYDLRRESKGVRHEWVKKVLIQLGKLVPKAAEPNTIIELHAGAPYAKDLREHLMVLHAYNAVLWPVEGLSQGHQRQWYAKLRKQAQGVPEGIYYYPDGEPIASLKS